MRIMLIKVMDFCFHNLPANKIEQEEEIEILSREFRLLEQDAGRSLWRNCGHNQTFACVICQLAIIKRSRVHYLATTKFSAGSIFTLSLLCERDETSLCRTRGLYIMQGTLTFTVSTIY